MIRFNSATGREKPNHYSGRSRGIMLPVVANFNIHCPSHIRRRATYYHCPYSFGSLMMLRKRFPGGLRLFRGPRRREFSIEMSVWCLSPSRRAARATLPPALPQGPPDELLLEPLHRAVGREAPVIRLGARRPPRHDARVRRAPASRAGRTRTTPTPSPCPRSSSTPSPAGPSPSGITPATSSTA